jgi:hypothetical protein
MRYTPRLIDESDQRLLLAVGQIVRCPDFATGLKWKATPDDPVMVAWSHESYVDYHIKSGKADSANDLTRAQAKFLVFAVSLVKAEGADDVFPGSFRYSRNITCVRLANDLSFTSESERICFTLNEPMSVAQPKECHIEILGCAQLPIFWEGGSQYE